MTSSYPHDDPVGYGLAGFGRFGRNRLVRAFAELPGSRIEALSMRDPEAARREAAEHGLPAGYGDLDALLADPAVEAVYVISANADHEAQTLASARAGKHVLCEKPLAPTTQACRRMIRACREAGVLLGVAHNLRFSPAVLQIREWIEAGMLGRIVSAQAVFTYDGTKSPRAWLYDGRIAGGGALQDVGVHGLDTLRFLLGEAVEARGLRVPAGDPVERTAETILHFASGALGRVLCSYESPYHSRLDVLGEKGRAWAEPFTIPWAEVHLRLETADETRDLTVATGNTFGPLIEGFSRAVRGRGPVPVPAEEGLRNAEIIEALYASGSFTTIP
ncbi:MAG: gfo/Idh/MocA family oxidoreductase [Candidatus Zixiibacteriota bacterium]|nr:MAG: gfo/Idh/MocA family oxidoreductase [candidate division Zixibacteria bacterium]